MPAVRKPAPKVATPTTPQEAADLARQYRKTTEDRSDAEKLAAAQKAAILAYLRENNLLDDDQAVPFEDGDEFLCLRYKLTPRTTIDLRAVPNDLIIWAAEHNILSASKEALKPHALTGEYAKIMEHEIPAVGSESLEFVAVTE